ncbi:hypothetical protein TSACC_2155 [Terrimicrobium sacchariphilum]|uniref:O-antigen ligase like membrane protein n=1 Tax=Terrimicrobium sacchariphilum TaxID=690879 RepID=A0A146G272_TERSA|nr:hypothetical protein [Terrimicrobium sacchariphilum]GAT31761.1 hypothetical protein TSACC_2155 [Terrimicrobium sacchariphilum]
MSPNAPINQNALVAFVVIALGLFGALFAGVFVARGNELYLAMGFVVLVGLTIALTLGRNYWMLIFATMGLSGSASVLPLPFSFAELGTLATFGLMIPYIALKRVRFNPRWEWSDYLLLINFAYLVTVWVRNPAGVRIFETEIVGGRAYVTVVIAMMGYFVLRNVFPSSRFVRWAPLVIAIPYLIHAGINVITQHFPVLGRVIYPIYSGVDVSDLIAADTSSENSRLTAYGMVTYPLILLLCAYFRPITLLNPFNFLGFIGLCVAIVSIALSGFRSAIFQLVGLMSVGTILRKRWSELIILVTIGTISLVGLVGLHAAGVQLPYGLQRAVSFLPIGLDEAAKANADETTEWRVDMWKDAWNTPEVINNKVLGDGFGFRQDVLRLIMQRLMSGTEMVGAKSYELHMLQGSFHSGPLSAIRFVGIVGFALMLVWMLALFVQSIRLVRKATGTPAAAWAIYTAMPLVYLPFGYIVIFGDYPPTLIAMIYATGTLSAIENYLQDRSQARKDAKLESTGAIPS